MAELSEEDGMHCRQKMQRLILRMRAKIQGRQLTGMRHRDVWSTMQRSVSQKFILRLQRQTPGKLPGGLSIKSDTETVGWGTDYTLERFTENGWEMIENSAAAWKHRKRRSGQKAVRQSQGETKEGTLDLAADGIRLEAGQYRLKKECRIFDDQNNRQTELIAEFQVEP